MNDCNGLHRQTLHTHTHTWANNELVYTCTHAWTQTLTHRRTHRLRMLMKMAQAVSKLHTIVWFWWQNLMPEYWLGILNEHDSNCIPFHLRGAHVLMSPCMCPEASILISPCGLNRRGSWNSMPKLDTEWATLIPNTLLSASTSLLLL